MLTHPMNDPMASAASLAEVVTRWASEMPESLAFRHLADGRGDDSSSLSYGQLDANARVIASAMLEQLGPQADEGARALLIYAPGLEFIEAFVACLYAGVTAVPVYPPSPAQLETTLPRLLAIATDAEPSLVLTTKMISGLLQPFTQPAPAFASARWLATDGAVEAGGAALVGLRARASLPALLQYTSGSTGTPKGVVVTHANLIANERAIASAFGTLDAIARGSKIESGVSWLPTYHDMGLMGKVLQTLYLGVWTTTMSPLTFIKQPVRWLEAISRYRATISGGPNFAFELCVRRIRDEEMEGLDLSSWRVAFCGAEPIRPETLERFAERFAPWGFDRAALFPCYGLAENTLIVSGAWLGQGADTLDLRAEAIERDRAELAAPGTLGSAQVVSCGGVVPDHEVRVVDPETREAAEPGGIGELWVGGPSVAAGYWRKPELSAETFAAELASGEGPFLRTGDLGFVHHGQVYVTGRRKELIVVRGRNIYPQDIEASVATCHAAIRPGGVVAVGLEVDGHEQAGLVVEVRKRKLDAATREQLEQAIRLAASTEHGLNLARLALVPPRTVPKTSSGKLQRTLVRDRLLAGTYDDALEAAEGEDSTASEEPSSALYDAPNDYFRKLEARNTHYRFELEDDVLWGRVDELGIYFTPEVLAQGSIDLEAMAQVDGLVDTFQWALAIAICEEFVALEQRILAFLRRERSAGRLPRSRSAELFDDEEVKHVQLFRRYADALKAQRPELAADLDRHLTASFRTAWWHEDSLDRYPNAGVYHFVNWLHFVYFEEYSIYLHGAMAADPSVQPAWISAHAAHAREERQHVVTDAAHLARLSLSAAEREQWSKWFLEQSARDASGLAGLEGVWTFLQDRFEALAALPQPGALLGNLDLRKRAFLRLLTKDNGFSQTLGASPGYAAFVRELDEALAQRDAEASAGADADSPAALELSLREELVQLVAAALTMDPARVDIDQPLVLFGLDSVQAVQIAGDLERSAGLSLSPTLLFEQPNIRALARAIAALRGDAEAGSSPAVEAAPEILLDESIFADDEPSGPRKVLVTGATGFLCGHLLAELLRATDDELVCLVRARSLEAGRERLRRNLEAYGLWREGLERPFAARVEVVLGDLSKPRLGLGPVRFDALAEDVDVIFHGGALVDFVQPYERLEAVNVGGTQEMIRLAVRGGRVPFNLISTIGIFDTKAQRGEARVLEGDEPDRAEGFRNGYGRSKWTAERLVQQARSRGLPVRVFRPGVVSGSTQTGAWQPDMVAALLKSFAETGTAITPTNDGHLDAAPVDYVAQAIVHIASKPDTLGEVFHLNNPRPTRWLDLYAAMAEIGYPLELTDYARWLTELGSAAADPAMKPYLAYFKARDQSWKLRQPPFDCQRALDALEDSDIRCPVLDGALLDTYLQYFRRVGFVSALPAQTREPGHV
ncbi:non-ribosomal peptide synthase [Plesiocystis pacifica SIR-1]|uniref:Non-ribosomal peptide synthase n=1 Tax=Plesiocystis pacifica SIR-1 TaxID=391625 RepID=A6GHN6_9BACT|nr:thioester reductase domain-containing protein [Plesiocystis pacifica]EDM74616.1 non-ribosomal peptide synthase [Plesiocystis pacifica SIR-1]